MFSSWKQRRCAERNTCLGIRPSESLDSRQVCEQLSPHDSYYGTKRKTARSYFLMKTLLCLLSMQNSVVKKVNSPDSKNNQTRTLTECLVMNLQMVAWGQEVRRFQERPGNKCCCADFPERICVFSPDREHWLRTRNQFQPVSPHTTVY